jgi:hypothetical protein
MPGSSPPRRRWARFSLRGLFVAIAVVGLGLGWLAWNIQQVRERRAVEKVLSQAGYVTIGGDAKIPLAWRWLGARPVTTMYVNGASLSKEDHARIARAFPEAKIHRMANPAMLQRVIHDWHGHRYR